MTTTMLFIGGVSVALAAVVLLAIMGRGERPEHVSAAWLEERIRARR